MKKRVINILTFVMGIMIGSWAVSSKLGEKLVREHEMSGKHLSLFLMMNHWVKVYQEGNRICSYFEKNGYKKIAIYGMSYVGETLLSELRKTTVDVKYAIDRNPDNIVSEVKVYSIEDDLEDVDAIIVTAITYFDEIRDVLEDKVKCPIISLESVVYES